jgi:hypothetical protein
MMKDNVESIGRKKENQKRSIRRKIADNDKRERDE